MRAPRRRFRFLRSALSTATAVAAPRRRAARRIGGALTVGFVGGGVALNSLDEGRTATVLAALVPATVDYQVVSWKHRNSSPEEAKDAFDDYHSRWADEPLRVIMKLRGFYVKTGQVLAGQPDVLPAAYGRSLKILQDSVPAQPFDVVREIVESELGCALEDVFSTFDETPLGAASIGQVHRATLSDGTEVVVKVQYPAAERFFRLDMETIKGIFRIANPEFVGVLECIEDTFEQEFDYVKEAACLRLAVNQFEPRFRSRGVSYPTPYDVVEFARPANAGLRAALPEALRGKGLVTRKVLVMRRCKGRTVSQVGQELLTAYAAKRGQTSEEFVDEMTERAKDPSYIEEVIRSQRSAAVVETYRWMLTMRDLFMNIFLTAWNLSVGAAGAIGGAHWKLPLMHTVLPPNGPAIIKLLYEIHAFQVFDTGYFNADCHAGNVLLDEETNNLSLIDYGQLIGPLDLAKRAIFARLIIAVDKKDAAMCKEAFDLLREWMEKTTGNDAGFVWKETGEINPPHACLAFASLQLGGTVGLVTALEQLGFDSVADLLGPKMTETITIRDNDPEYLMFGRMVACLRGLGDSIGAQGVPPAKMMRPAAERFLRQHPEV